MARKKASAASALTAPISFKTIKTLAKPGAWRRGYGYYQKKGQVMSVDVTKTGLEGKVKGNYQDAYEITLTLSPEGDITPTCSCPLDEVWCKHVVSVALTGIKTHQFEAFYGIAPWEPLIPVPPIAAGSELSDVEWESSGNYRFGLAWDIVPRMLSLQVWDKSQQTQLMTLAPLLKALFELQKSGQLTLTADEKRELKLIQFLYKNAQADPETGWYHLPFKHQAEVLEMLRGVDDLCHPPTETRIVFSENPLTLLLSINASMVGNVLISLHWHRDLPTENVWPLDEIRLFGRDIPWGYYQGVIYPLKGSLGKLPQYLSRSTFYDIRDADGAKFLFEELPKIRDFVDIEQAEVIDKATIAQEPPQKIVKLKRFGTMTLRGELEFSYDETRVPYSKGHEAPYVTVTNKEKDEIYWLKRNRKLEEQAFKQLMKCHVDPLGNNHFEAEEDKAIDFYNADCEKLRAEGWAIETEDPDEDLSDFKTSPDPLQICAEIDFYEAQVDQFTLRIYCAIGEERLDLDTVQGFFVSGRKYIALEGKGYVEIPLVAILSFTKTLQSFDKETLEQDCYLIKTYQAGLINELAEQGVTLKLSEKFQQFWRLITAFDVLEDIEIPEKVNAELRPYQKHGFNWLWFLYSYGLNGILADDMGLGKTLQTLVLLQKAKDQDGRKASLIVCPTSVVYNWQRESEKFTPDLKILNLTGSERHGQLRNIAESDIVITSYALLRRDIKILKQYGLRYVILDESQNIKNVESQTAMASKQLNAQHRLALSGTPIENRLSELWSAFDFLMPGFLLDLDEFRFRYVSPIEEKGNADASKRLKAQISPFILRRLKKDVAKDLPDKLEFISYCDLIPEQQELYRQVLDKTREEMFAKMKPGAETVSQAQMLSALLRLRQVCCHPKLLKDYLAHDGVGSGKFDALTEMLEEIISEGHRILLFSQFVEMLNIVEDWVQRKGIRYEKLTGETKDRIERVERFNRDSGIPIFLISLKAGGTGLNLTGADYVIHYDPWWNPAAEDQATDRAHRIGQTKKVFVYRMITRGTVEEKIVKLQDKKRNLVDSVISVDRDLAKKISFEDLKDILTPDF